MEPKVIITAKSSPDTISAASRNLRLGALAVSVSAIMFGGVLAPDTALAQTADISPAQGPNYSRAATATGPQTIPIPSAVRAKAAPARRPTETSRGPTQTPAIAQANSAFECRSSRHPVGQPGFAGLAVMDTEIEESVEGWYSVTTYNPAPLRVFGFAVVEAAFNTEFDDYRDRRQIGVFLHQHSAVVRGDYQSVKRAVEESHGVACSPSGRDCMIIFDRTRALSVQHHENGVRLLCTRHAN